MPEDILISGVIPLSSDRIDALREVVDESEYTDVKDTEEEQNRLEMAKAKLRGFLEGPQVVFSKYPPSDQSQACSLCSICCAFQSS